jgi:hypothetical protein
LKHAIFAFALTGLSFNINAQSVLLDSHSDAGGAKTWNITTTHAHELILIAADGYGSNPLPSAPGNVTVNGNNATYITAGHWFSGQAWDASIWAYEAPVVGTYTMVCTESGFSSPWYFNYASAVYDPNDSLKIADILIGGHDSNQAMTTVTTTITTTKNNSFVFGSTCWNDNGGTGTLNWNGGLTELNHDYISNGVDAAQADSTIAVAGLQTITVTDIGASGAWSSIVLVAVQPPCALIASAVADSNVSACGGKGMATATPSAGTAPYTYAWAPLGGTNATATGLTAATYTVTITDAVSCSATASVNITQAPALAMQIDSIIMFNCKDSLWGVVTGGNAPYSYKWTPGGSTRDTIGHLCPGNYKLVVTDALGCKDSITVTAIAGIDEVNGLNEHVQVSPNPFSQNLNVDISLQEPLVITMYNMLGENVGGWKMSSGHNVINTAQYPSGIYMLQIKTADGTLLDKKVMKIN